MQPQRLPCSRRLPPPTASSPSVPLPQAKVEDATAWAAAKWEASDNKPGIVATGFAALLAIYVTSGVLST